MESDATKIAELRAIVEAVRDRVRARYPEASGNGAGDSEQSVRVPIADLDVVGGAEGDVAPVDGIFGGDCDGGVLCGGGSAGESADGGASGGVGEAMQFSLGRLSSRKVDGEPQKTHEDRHRHDRIREGDTATARKFRSTPLKHDLENLRTRHREKG